MYTAEQKANEKQTVFNTSSWTDKRQISTTQNKTTNISLDDLLTPQYDQGGNTGQVDYSQDSNSVYNPNSNLGGSVFQKDSFDYYLDRINTKNQQKAQAQQEDEKEKNIYMIGAVLAVAYLGYRFL